MEEATTKDELEQMIYQEESKKKDIPKEKRKEFDGVINCAPKAIKQKDTQAMLNCTPELETMLASSNQTQQKYR